MKKTYNCSKTMAYLSFGSKHIEFKGGSFAGGTLVPSCYTTEDESMQKSIEACEMFQKKQIWIISPPQAASEESGDPEPIEAPASLNPEVPEPPSSKEDLNPKPAAESKIFEDVTNGQQAKNKLIDLGLKIEFIAKNAETIALAKANNISFPNWQAFIEA